MRKLGLFLKAFLLCQLLAVSGFSITIHFLNPWADDSLNFIGQPIYVVSALTDWVPGTPAGLMTNEGGDWWVKTVDASGATWENFGFAIGIPPNYNTKAFFDSTGITAKSNQEKYIRFLDLTAKFWDVVWIYLEDSKVIITDIPPISKVVMIYNPWPASAPMIKADAEPYENMRLSIDKKGALEEPLCGWFTYYFTGNAQYLVHFQEIIGKKLVYGKSGLGSPDPIDLKAHFAVYDTAYILPSPQPTATIQAGLPTILPNRPVGVIGQCQYDLAFTIRDFSVEHPDFYMTLEVMGGKPITGMVEDQLGPKGKPVKKDDNRNSKFEEWFEDVPGVNHSKCQDLPMSKTKDGYWQFDSYYTDHNGNANTSHQFFPIDDFNNFDEIFEASYQLKQGEKFILNWQKDPAKHNFHFCLEMHAKFKYEKGQQFTFTGDDDVWAFIDKKLVIDLGGLHTPAVGKIPLDLLGLTEGREYPFDFFYCERQPVGSNLMVKTSIYFEQELNFFFKTNELNNGFQLNVYERSGGSGSCADIADPSKVGVIDTLPAPADIFLSGGTLTGEVQLNTANPYAGKGLEISADSQVVLDTTMLRQSRALFAGQYMLKLISRGTPKRILTMPFQVHGDFSVKFDPKPVIDTIVGVRVPVTIQALEGVTATALPVPYVLIPDAGLVVTDAAGNPITTGMTNADGKDTVYVTGTGAKTYNLGLAYLGVKIEDYPMIFSFAGLAFDRASDNVFAGTYVPVTILSTFKGITPIPQVFVLSASAGMTIYADSGVPASLIAPGSGLTTSALAPGLGTKKVWVTGDTAAILDKTYTMIVGKPGAVPEDTFTVRFNVAMLALGKETVDTLAGHMDSLTVTAMFASSPAVQQFTLHPEAGLSLFEDKDGLAPLDVTKPQVTGPTGTKIIYIKGAADAPATKEYSLGVRKPGAVANEAERTDLKFRIPLLRFVGSKPPKNPIKPQPISNKALQQGYFVVVELYTRQWAHCGDCVSPLSVGSLNTQFLFSTQPDGQWAPELQITPEDGFASFYVKAIGTPLNVQFAVQGVSEGTRAEWNDKVDVIYEVKRAWITDEDRQGDGDRVLLEFIEPLWGMPATITSIDWPNEGVGGKKGVYELNNLAASNMMQLNDTILAVDFSDDPFEQGKTGILRGTPPALNVGGTVVRIEDGIGAVPLKAEIVAPAFRQYLLADDDAKKIRLNPDTLIVTVSEPVVSTGSSGTGLSLFLIVSGCLEGEQPTPVPMSQAQALTGDSLKVRIPLVKDQDDVQIRVEDCLYFNPAANYTDYAGNPTSPVQVEVGGEPGDFDSFKTALVRPIVGSGNTKYEIFNSPSLEAIPIVNAEGDIVSYYSGSEAKFWHLPPYLRDDGTINTKAARNCEPVKNDATARKFPINCLSAVSVVSEGPYTAEVNIFDNFGGFLHHSVQPFGFCGEVEDESRLRPGGYASFLVWNQKDINGKYAGSGVYIWNVLFKFAGGGTRLESYKQGIARSSPPDPKCAVAQ